MRALSWLALLVGCGAGDRAPGVSGEHPAGMALAPPSVLGQGAAGPNAASRGVIRQIPSLMRWPSAGDPAPGDVVVTFGGAPVAVREGAFDPGGRFGWFELTRGSVKVLARVDAVNGELTLPVLHPAATGMPRPDRAAVVLQLMDNEGNPLVGLTADEKPGVIGPCYDNSDDRVADVPRATNSRGAIAYLQIDPVRGTFETTVNVFGRPIVAQVPIVAGTVTFLRTTLN